MSSDNFINSTLIAISKTKLANEIVGNCSDSARENAIDMERYMSQYLPAIAQMESGEEVSIINDLGKEFNWDRNTIFSFIQKIRNLKKNKQHFEEDCSLVSVDQIQIEDDESQEDFPIQVLNDYPALGLLINEISRVYNIPQSYSAAQIFSVIAAACGKGIQCNYLNYLTTPNIYTIPAASSGSGKSVASKILLEPIFKWQAEKLLYWKENDLPKLKAELEWQEKKLACLKGVKSEEQFIQERTEIEQKIDELNLKLRCPYSVICEDITTEALCIKLHTSNGSLFSYSPDAAKVLDNLKGRYNSSHADDSIYLKAFTGEDIFYDRKNCDVIHVEKPSLSLLWLSTPDRLEGLLGNQTLSLGGFLPRCFIVGLASKRNPLSLERPDPISSDAITLYHGLILQLLDTYWKTETVATLKFDDDAEKLLVVQANLIISRMNDNQLGGVESFANRWIEQAVKLSVVLHVSTYGITSHKHAIGAKTVNDAWAIARWFQGHQLDLLSRVASSPKSQKMEKAKDIIPRALKHISNPEQCIYPKHLYRAENGGSKLCNSAKEANALLQELVKEGFLIGAFRPDDPQKQKMIFYKLAQ